MVSPCDGMRTSVVCSSVHEVLMESSSIHTQETNEETESVMRLVEISAGYWLPRVLHVVADLGVADALDEETRSAGYLAKKVGRCIRPSTATARFSRHTRSARRHVRAQRAFAGAAQ